MDNLKESLLAQLDAAIDLFQEFNQAMASYKQASSAYQSFRFSPPATPSKSIADLEFIAGAFVAAAVGAVERCTGRTSTYYMQASQYASGVGKIGTLESLSERNLLRLTGVVQVVRRAVAEDYLQSAQELVRAEVFSDFLEMAEHLQEEGYKDPAAVVAGTVLEQHLRKLCLKHNLTIEATDTAGKLYPKKAEALNTELAGQKVYGKNEQKQVTAWLGIRNSAAHGKYGEYTHAQVDLLLQGIRGFLARYPA